MSNFQAKHVGCNLYQDYEEKLVCLGCLISYLLANAVIRDQYHLDPLPGPNIIVTK